MRKASTKVGTLEVFYSKQNLNTLSYILLGHESIVRLLIDNGADVNLLNKGRKSALHMAAFNGNELNCDALLKHGALVDVVDFSGRY